MLFAVAGTGISVSAQPAFAVGDSSCPHGANYTSSACFYGVVMDAIAVQWHRNSITLPLADQQAGGHINHSIWFYMGSPCNDFVETGLTRGYVNADSTSGYQWYTGWAVPADLIFEAYPDGTTTASGTNDVYAAAWNGGSSYSVIRDLSARLTVTGLPSGGSCIAQSGLEVQKAPGSNPTLYMADGHADTFDATPLQYHHGGVWISGWDTTEYWQDRPCGAGYSSPTCLNGVFYGSNHWADNKP
jgi:hypothetical protein